MKRIIIFFLLLISLYKFTEARQPQAGYRGFLEWSNSLRSDNIGGMSPDGSIVVLWREKNYFTGLSTSHGYQINKMFFIGAGIGLERSLKSDNWILPIFAEGRVDFQFGRFTPFTDVRLGANLADGTGIYFSPSIGYRFNWGRKVGLNISAGLKLAGYKEELYEGTWEWPDKYDLYYVGTRHNVKPYFSFGIGLDF